MSLVIFTVAVMVVFVVTGGIEPSTLIVSVFGFCGFEFGIMGWIKSVKEKEKAKEEKLKNTETNTEQE